MKVAVVDFGAIGEGIPLDGLLSKTDFEFVVVDPLDLGWQVGGDVLADNTMTVARQLTALTRPPRFLVAQCAGTVFALELAARLAATGAPLHGVVAVEPVVVTADLVAAHVSGLVARLGSESTPDVDEAVAALAGSPARLSTYVRPLFRSAAEQRSADMDLDADEAALVVETIVNRYADWVGFLAVQVGRRGVEPGCAVHTLSTAGQPAATVPDRIAGVLRGYSSPDGMSGGD